MMRRYEHRQNTMPHIRQDFQWNQIQKRTRTSSNGSGLNGRNRVLSNGWSDRRLLPGSKWSAMELWITGTPPWRSHGQDIDRPWTANWPQSANILPTPSPQLRTRAGYPQSHSRYDYDGWGIISFMDFGKEIFNRHGNIKPGDHNGRRN